jgi:hypothetical protein
VTEKFQYFFRFQINIRFLLSSFLELAGGVDIGKKRIIKILSFYLFGID